MTGGARRQLTHGRNAKLTHLDLRNSSLIAVRVRHNLAVLMRAGFVVRVGAEIISPRTGPGDGSSETGKTFGILSVWS